MKRALSSMSCLVLSVAALASGCVDDDPKKAVHPSNAPGELCGQTGQGKGAGGKDLFTFEVINSFEQEDELRMEDGQLVFDDDETLDGDGIRCAGAKADAPFDTNTKERWNANGDGVVGYWDLNQAGDPLGQCTTVTGQPNLRALNFWGPYYTQHSETGDEPGEGYAYSGGTIPLYIADYTAVAPRTDVTWDKGLVIDASQFKGIALWARLATAEEAVSVEDAIRPPDTENGGAPGVIEAARAQDGVARLSVMIQTVQTSAFESVTLDAIRTAMENGTLDVQVDIPEEPCIDYDTWQCAQPGEGAEAGVWTRDKGETGEVGFRNQCWDGFRTEIEITSQWRFYMLPFSAMRQAGWGRVAEKFNTDQIRTISLSTGAFQPINVLVDEVSFYR